MSTEPIPNQEAEITAQDHSAAKEARLLEIREHAAKFGTMEARGLSIESAPFPIASPATGYYGVPLLKQPQWTPEIPVYFFVGGAAGSAAVIGAMATWTGADEKLRRDARMVAATGAVLSSALLISDLGRPSRFLNMLRVFKPQSPMSMGAWVLSGFGTFSGAAATAQVLADRFGWGAFQILGNIAEGFSALFGLPLSSYTGVLIGATVIPVWNHNVKTLPLHFAMSGLNAGTSILELLGNDAPALNRLGIAASALETYEGYHLEVKRDPVVNAPLKHGTSGWITRLGGVLSGPVPLVLRVAAEFAGTKNSRSLRRAAAVSSIAGSILTRFGWVRAGHASAKDWRLPLLDKHEKRIIPMQSESEYPRLRKMG